MSTLRATNIKHELSATNQIVLGADGSIGGTLGDTLAAKLDADTQTVVQMVASTHATMVTNTSNTYADTGLSATITPSSASNNVLVIVTQAGCQKRAGNAGSAVELRLVRDAVGISAFEGAGGYDATTSANTYGSSSIAYLDSPATTSAVTYKTQFRNEYNGDGVRVQVDSAVSSIVLLEIKG